MITKERVLELFDYSDGRFIRKSARGGQRIGAIAGTKDSYGYSQFAIDGRLYLAHRLAWLVVHGEWPQSELDHINGDRSDNRIENLRLSDRLRNCANRHGARSDSETGVLGVRFVNGKYVTRLQVDGHRKYVGAFESLEAASHAYFTARENAAGVLQVT